METEQISNSLLELRVVVECVILCQAFPSNPRPKFEMCLLLQSTLQNVIFGRGLKKQYIAGC